MHSFEIIDVDLNCCPAGALEKVWLSHYQQVFNLYCKVYDNNNIHYCHYMFMFHYSGTGKYEYNTLRKNLHVFYKHTQISP